MSGPAAPAVDDARRHRRRTVTSLVFALVALLLVVPATVAIARAERAVVRTSAVVDGVPVTVLTADPGQARPGVVVMHGFAGSAQLMDGIGLTLAQAGYAVALLDVDGHGANPRPLALGTDDRPAADQLARDLDTVVAWFGARPEVASGRLALVGHSMGAGAVVRYAAADAAGARRIGATVALSLPDGDDVPAGRPDAPRNLLLLWGAGELSRFVDAGTTALDRAYPGADTGVTYGDPAAGTARRADVVPGVEHISILFSQRTLADTVSWLETAYAQTGTPGEPGFDTRVLWLVVLTVGAALGFVPLARLAFGDRPPEQRRDEPSASAPVLPMGAALGIGAGSAVVASVVAWALPDVAAVLPVAVGGYVWLWFGTAGVVAGVVAWVVGTRRTHAAAARIGAQVPTSSATGRGLLRPILATLAMTAYAVAVLALAGQHTWTAFALVGDRTWLVPVMEVSLLAYFWADERLAARASRRRRLVVVVVNRMVAVVVILASVVLLGAPGFLTLLLPLMVLLFVLLGSYAFVVSGLTHERWAPAVVQAIPLAYLVATTFPLVT